MIRPPRQSELVGIDKRVADVVDLLYRSNDVIMVDIWGRSRLGKTTLGKAVFDHLSPRFEGRHCLIKDPSIYCNNTIQDLWKKLVTEMSGSTSTSIEDWLSNNRILIILDNVSEAQLVKDLYREKNRCQAGSKIIVITEDKIEFPDECDGQHHYSVMPLDPYESDQLFRMHAQPTRELTHLADEIVRYAGGNPSFLKDLGTYLHSKDRGVWKNKKKELKRLHEKNIYNISKMIFDDSNLEEKSVIYHEVIEEESLTSRDEHDEEDSIDENDLT